MQNDQSKKRGARTHHQPEDGDVLSPAERRGLEFRRYTRAAAAMAGLFDDKAIAQAIGRSRMTLNGWWNGARPDPESIRSLAEVTGLSADELVAWLYFDGRPPSWPVAADSAAREATREGIRRDQVPQAPEDPQGPAPSPERPPRGSGAGRA